MPFETAISLLVSLAALLFTAMSFRRNAFQDNSSDAADRANMRADLRYIRDSVDEIKLEYKGLQKEMIQLREDIVRIDASVKSAHKRIDGITGKQE